MPEKETLRRARRDKRQGKSSSTQAGEFVREEMHHIREGKHGAKNTKQAIAIGLSKARRGRETRFAAGRFKTEHATEREIREPGRPQPSQAVRSTLARGQSSAETRGASSRIA